MVDVTTQVGDIGSTPIYDTPKLMLSRFYFLQEERVQTYHLFDEGFQAYLNGAPNYNFPLYRQLVFEITQTFTKISQEILTIKNKFAEQNNLMPIATIINKIQVAEESKLEMTAKLQISLQKEKDTPDSEDVKIEIEQIRSQLKEKKDIIIEQMEELKYESEDLYVSDTEPEPEDSIINIDR